MPQDVQPTSADATQAPPVGAGTPAPQAAPPAASIDYNALAQKFGGTTVSPSGGSLITPAQPQTQPSAPKAVDYSALAAKYGGTTVNPAAPKNLPNPKGEGLYQMHDMQGNVVSVPYSQVPTMQEARGYQFETDQEHWKYAKDNAADPNRVSRYTPAVGEQTPEGRAAAQQAREQAAPIGAGIGKGSGDILDMMNPVNVAKGAVEEFPPVKLANSIQQSIPAFKAFEKAYKDGGGSISDGLAAANDVAKKQDAIRQTFEKVSADFKKNPTEETARAVTDAAGIVAQLFLGDDALGAGAKTPEDVEAAGIPSQARMNKVIDQMTVKGGPRVAAAQTAEKAGISEGTPAKSAETFVQAPLQSALKSSAKGTITGAYEGSAPRTAPASEWDDFLNGKVPETPSASGPVNYGQISPITENSLDRWQVGKPTPETTNEYAPQENVGGTGYRNIEDISNKIVDKYNLPKGYGTEPYVPPRSVRDVFGSSARTVLNSAKSDFKALDNASGGRWQRFNDQLKNIQSKMADVAGIDDDAYANLESRRNEIETLQAQMIEDLKTGGEVDPSIADRANTNYKKAMALQDVNKAVQMSVERTVPGRPIIDPFSGDLEMSYDAVNPVKLQSRLAKLSDIPINGGQSRLVQALGERGAQNLISDVDTAFVRQEVESLPKGKQALTELLAKHQDAKLKLNLGMGWKTDWGAAYKEFQEMDTVQRSRMFGADDLKVQEFLAKGTRNQAIWNSVKRLSGFGVSAGLSFYAGEHYAGKILAAMNPFSSSSSSQ